MLCYASNVVDHVIMSKFSAKMGLECIFAVIVTARCKRTN